MKTIFEIPTRADDMTQPGGIALRFNSTTEELIVHNYTTDRATETERNYFSGNYYTSGSLVSRFVAAMRDFNNRIENAGTYETGGAIDIVKVLDL